MMTDNSLRHIVAFIATLVCALAYMSGYVSGQHGWWWSVFAVLIIYGIMYKLIDAGHK